MGGEMLAAAADPKLRLLKEDGGTAKDFSGSKGFIFITAVTPDGQIILGGGQDSVLRIWNANTGKSLFNLEPPPAESTAQSVRQAAEK